MSSKTLERLLNAGRPLKTFSIELNGETFHLQTKAPTIAISQASSDIWNDAYAASLKKSEESPVTGADLKRFSNSQLAKFISRADRRDLAYEASAENDDKPIEDPVVKKRTDELVLEREQEILANVPQEEMLRLATERQAHFNAVRDANTASARYQVRALVMDDEGNPLITSDAELEELTNDQLFLLMKGYNEALNPPKVADSAAGDDGPLS
jgi:hypothetical protein